MFGDRIDFFLDALADSSVGDESKECVRDILVLLRRLNLQLDDDGRLKMDGAINAPRHLIERRLNELRGVLAEGEDIPVLTWVAETAGELARSIERGPVSPGLSYFMVEEATEARAIGSRAATLLDRYILRRDRDQILSEAREAVERASGAAEIARESAGIAGGAALSKHFGDYARGERAAAETFRVLAVLSVIGAFSAVVAFGPVVVADVPHLIYRVALFGASGALAGYFARQAGQHRRVYNWAKSLEVQMRSFPAFIEPIPDDDRGEVYRLFARRVLGAPPSKDSDVGDESIGAAQVMDLLSAVARRNS